VRVTNDYEVDEVGQMTIITGSNMAGKSTFLRTVGVNLALAYAGGPVVAGSLHTSLFRLFASIRVADSLTDGFSFFYAEVRQLAQLLSELQADEARPLFFLIDEIFRGTNNRERLIGSRAYIRALAAGRGTGLIATHDLELIHLAEENGKIHNAHFRDDVVDGRMVFDYKLHPGPCPTTNALKIMRLAGLPVEEM
jgi:DNA mismatch repair ATPase MutS